jgi:hypothetical protein
VAAQWVLRTAWRTAAGGTAGTVAEWRRWTGMAFDRSGEWVVPGGRVPVHVSLEQDRGVYVEPNVWVRHTV